MLSLSNHGKAFLILVLLCATGSSILLYRKVCSTRHRWIYLSNVLSNHNEAQTSAARVMDAKQLLHLSLNQIQRNKAVLLVQSLQITYHIVVDFFPNIPL